MDRRCPNCWLPNPDFAHGVFEAVAATLAEPLRRALREHEAACPHCSADLPRWDCVEYQRLSDLQAYGDQPIALAGPPVA